MINSINSLGIASRTFGLAVILASIAALATAGKPATDVPASVLARAADQVQPERRIKRLGQLYEEIQKLLKEHHAAMNLYENLEKQARDATATQTDAAKQLKKVLLQEKAQRVMDGRTSRNIPINIRNGAVSPRLNALIAQETTLRQQIKTAQDTLATLQPQWADAKQRSAQLSKTLKTEMPKKKEEWLWLCDPLGRLGKIAPRAAIELCSQQIAQDNKLGLSYLARGFGYLHAEQYSEALNDFARVVALDKEMASVATAGRGWAFARMRRDSEAGTEFRKVHKSKSMTPLVELVLGHAYSEKQKNELAEKHFRKAADLAQRLPQAQDALAFFLATHRGDDPTSAKHAIQRATKACEMTGWGQWVYLDTLAMACAAAGEFQLASEWGAKALQCAPREYRTDLQKRLDLYAAKKPYQPSGFSSGVGRTGSDEGVKPRHGGKVL